jgi:XTP/dITP diphosphohydrolase
LHNLKVLIKNLKVQNILYFVSMNKAKFEEVARFLAGQKIKVKWIKMAYPELQADSLEEVARSAIISCVKKTKKPTLIEDSGLFINALRGFPGIYSSFVFKTLGNEGVLQLLRDASDRRAYFKSVIAFGDLDLFKGKLFSGSVNGVISENIRGKSGFGFDPIFMPDALGKTFAEMSLDEKNRISHRARALKKFIKWYKEYKK